MTIRRGEPWGDVGPMPAGSVTVHSDAEVGALVEQCRRDGRPCPAVVLMGGDLMRAVGGTGDAARTSGDMAVLTVDVVRVRCDGATAERWFVAHLVARRSWWRGELVAAMNAQHLGAWDVAPRAHPNDGKVDIVQVDEAMSVRDRWRAGRRATQAGHVPHPRIHTRSARDKELRFGRPLTIWLDGRRWTTASALDLIVEPDALTVCV